MTRANFRVILRNLIKQKGYSVINILGLSFGIAFFVIVIRYITFELSYDKYHSEHERIYRINMSMKHFDNETKESAFDLSKPNIPAPLVGQIRKDFPFVENSVRINRKESELISNSGVQLNGNDIMFVDPDFFNIFSTPFLIGNPNTALDNPNSVVITQRTAEMIFGESYELGNILKIGEDSYELTGIVENPPTNTHLKYNFLASTVAKEQQEIDIMQWASWGYEGYIKLIEGEDPKEFEQKLNLKYGSVLGNLNITFSFFLEPVSKIHLNMIWTGVTDPKQLKVLFLIALSVIVLACINSINLTTAQASFRINEVNLRRSLGASKINIVGQLINESLVFSLIAVLFATVLVFIFNPISNQILERDFTFMDYLEIDFIPIIIIIVLVIGVSLGLFHSILFPAVQSDTIITRNKQWKLNKLQFRNLLLIFQFMISTVLIIGISVIVKQVDFMTHKDLGFSKEGKLVIPIDDGEDYRFYKEQFLKHPSIIDATASNKVPGTEPDWNSVRLPNEMDSKKQLMNFAYTDADFIDKYEIDLVAGRFFNQSLASDIGGPLVINEAAMNQLGWHSPEEAIGEELVAIWSSESNHPQPIIGVIKDFHTEGLQKPIEPLIIVMVPDRFECITLNVDQDKLTDVITYTEAKFSSMFEDENFSYTILEDRIEKLYTEENKILIMTKAFTVLSLLISCFGLYSMVGFLTIRREKEIMIKKVFGSSAIGIYSSITKQLVGYIITACVLACPLAYLILNKWLSNFAYRTDFSINIFIYSSFIIICCGLLSVSYHIFKAANANPVDSLRHS